MSGKITYEDGSLIPVQSIQLTFVPQASPADRKTYPRQGKVGVNVADGTFDTPTTYKPADGLIPGKHKVIVTAFDGGREPSSKVPREYTRGSTTPLEMDSADSPVHLKIRKP